MFGVHAWETRSNFLVAIRYNNLAACSKLLGAGADCDQQFKIHSVQRPALSIAAGRHGGYEVVKLLLHHGASVNLPDSNGATPLHSAVKGGSEQVCRLLVENRANLNAVDKDGVSPLHLAVQRGSSAITELLLNKGADVNRLDRDYLSALHHACSLPCVNQDIIDLLLCHGAAVDQFDGDLLTPFMRLLQSSNFTFATFKRFVENGARLHLNDGKAPIHNIILSQSPDKVQCLELILQYGSELNLLASTTKKMETGLHLCAMMNDVACARVLLLAGADADAVDRLGFTPLETAVSLGCIGVMDLLISAGVRCKKKLAPEVKLRGRPALISPPKLIDICRRAVWKKAQGVEKLKDYGVAGELPKNLIPFLLLED